MRKVAIGIVVAVAATVGTPAFAADMAVKAPPLAPAPVYSWTGWYVGGNVGYSWGKAGNNLFFSQTDPGDTNLAAFNATDSPNVKGAIGGAQAGYNWQVANFVYGVETDIQASGQRGTDTFSSVIQNRTPGFANLGNNPATVNDANKLRWFGTTRGRVGAVMDRWLVYGTGGVAYGEVSQSGNVQPANVTVVNILNAPIVWNQSTTKVGWAVGAGVENAITQNWSWKVEYLYMDLGTATANLSGGVGTIGNLALNCYGAPGGLGCNNFHNPASGSITTHFTDNIVRIGLNYQFH